MAEMKLLKHLVFLLSSARVILGGSVSLTRSGQDAVLGREFSFTCTVDADRVVGLISFMRDEAQSSATVCHVAVDTGKQITGNEKFLCLAVAGQSHTYSLTIRKVSRNDSTVWGCQGAGMKSDNVTLDVRYPPTVAIHAVAPCSGLTFLVNESNVALNCSVEDANPAPTNFTWYRRDVFLQSGPSPIYNLGLVTRSRRYTCTADNGISPPGQAKEKVVVHYPPTVRVDATKRVARKTEDLTVQCTAAANPEVTSVVWTKKSVNARKSENGTLHLKNIQRTDAGVYVCTATNNVTSCSGTRQTKSSSASVTLEVQYPPTVAIHAVAPCSGLTFLVNESNALNCSVEEANPAPTNFTWYHGDVTLQRGPSPIYNLGRVTRSSGGRYTCTADNGIFLPGQAIETVVVHYPPTVHVGATERVARETEDLTIQCTTKAEPNATSVFWTKEGVGARKFDSGTLHLENIQRTDAGEYICTATNLVTSCSGTRQTKSSSASVTLEVQYAPEVQYFGVTSGVTTIREHDDVTLQCRVRSNPASSIEIRNQTSIIGSSSSRDSVAREGDTQTLTAMLLSVSCLEGGDYTCAARNLVGETSSETIPLSVRCVPRRSSSDKLVFTSDLGENVTLSLTVIAFPLPTFTWRRKPNARPMDTARIFTEGVLVTGSVTIFDVEETDYINYIVNVNNTEGELDLEIPLISKSQPQEPTNLKAVNIQPRSVTLTWEKSFNGGAKQRFNIQYRQPGGQWTTHPTSPTEDDILRLDIDGLEPGTVYEFRINARNEYGNSSYAPNVVTTAKDPTNYTTIVCVVVAVVVIVAVVLTVVVVRRWRNKQKGGGRSAAGQGEEDEDRVVAVNDLYETSADLNITPAGTGAAGCSNDVYAVVNKPAKKNGPVEDLYAMPLKGTKKEKNRGKTRKKLEDQTEDIYAQPEKKKGKTKGKKKGLGADSGQRAGDEKKEGQKTGIDEDGLLYVSVDFSRQPPASDTITRSEEETQYVGIDYAASAAKQE